MTHAMTIIWLLLGSIGMLALGEAQAQAFPSRALRLVIPTAPGSIMDSIARLVSPILSESLGHPVVPEARAGANGLIGADMVAKAAPDGHTLMISASATLVASPYFYKTLPFDPRKDFTPITEAADAITCLVVPSSLPVNTVQELIEHMKRNPGKLAFGSSGIGSAFHLTAEMFKRETGVDFVHVPYKGAAPMVQDVVIGQVQWILSAVNSVIPHVNAGKLKALAIMHPHTFAGLPGVPPITQTHPNLERPPGWFGFVGPANLPAPILARLHAEIVNAINSAQVRPRLEASGLLVIANTPQEFAKIYAAGFESYGRIVKLVGIQPE